MHLGKRAPSSSSLNNIITESAEVDSGSDQIVNYNSNSQIASEEIDLDGASTDYVGPITEFQSNENAFDDVRNVETIGNDEMDTSNQVEMCDADENNGTQVRLELSRSKMVTEIS